MTNQQNTAKHLHFANNMVSKKKESYDFILKYKWINIDTPTRSLPSFNHLNSITFHNPKQDNKVNSTTTYQQQVKILLKYGVDQLNPTKQMRTDPSKQI
jgi:hypothetical protein